MTAPCAFCEIDGDPDCPNCLGEAHGYDPHCPCWECREDLAHAHADLDYQSEGDR